MPDQVDECEPKENPNAPDRLLHHDLDRARELDWYRQKVEREDPGWIRWAERETRRRSAAETAAAHRESVNAARREAFEARQQKRVKAVKLAEEQAEEARQRRNANLATRMKPV